MMNFETTARRLLELYQGEYTESDLVKMMGILAYLETNNQICISEPTPTIPVIPVYPNPFETRFRTVCHICGIDFDQAMGYVCPNARCPMGVGPMTCTTTEGSVSQ